MMPDGKRLRRGLKDISPLFDHGRLPERTPVSLKAGRAIQSLAVFCPQDAIRNLYLSTRLASRIQLLGGECVLLSIVSKNLHRLEKLAHIENSESRNMKRFHLTLDQLEEVCHSDAPAAQNFGSPVFFFNCDFTNPLQLKKVVPMLDKGIFFLRPELESLTEAFKFIKTSLALNPTLEYFVICEGAENAQKSGILYERFSEMVSRRIGVSVNWLGSCSGASSDSFSGISTEPLQAASALDTVEKRSLAGWVYPDLRFRE